MLFIGVTDPINPRLETPEEVRDRVLEAAQIIPVDIAHLLRTNWTKLGPLLNGKIHLTVGTADTFHLDKPARLLEQTIKDLGGTASFTYVEGRSHFDLYQGGLSERIAKEMYAVARPTRN